MSFNASRKTQQSSLQAELEGLGAEVANLSQNLAQSAEGLKAEQGANVELGSKADQLQKQVDELQASYHSPADMC